MKEISDALNAFVAAAASGLHVAMPGRVESYDPVKQRVHVQPVIRRGFTEEDGSRSTEQLPIVPDVPVVFPGSGPYSISWPIAKGDIVLLVFADQSLDRWLALGEIVDPQDDRNHTLSDAIAIPGLRPFTAPIGGAPSGAGGPMVIQAPGEIHAGGSAPLATKADLDALASVFDGWTPVAMDGGAELKSALTALLASWPNGTTKLKGS